MDQIGYSLVDAKGQEVWSEGDIKGHLSTMSSPILLPNGDQVQGAKVGDQLGEWRLVARRIRDDRPSQWHAEIGRTVSYENGEVFVTVEYEAKPSIVPQTVTPRQARLALLEIGRLADADTAAAGAGAGAKVSWDYATEINRQDPLIVSLGGALGLDLDALFRRAVSF